MSSMKVITIMKTHYSNPQDRNQLSSCAVSIYLKHFWLDGALKHNTKSRECNHNIAKRTRNNKWSRSKINNPKSSTKLRRNTLISTVRN